MAALGHDGVGQRGLAVVHVGDDGDIAYFRIQVKTPRTAIGAYYYFTMSARFEASAKGKRWVVGADNQVVTLRYFAQIRILAILASLWFRMR